MKIALPSRIGPPLPSAQVCERVAVGPLARKFPLLPAPYQAKAPPPTQVLRPPFFDNKNEFFAPLVQVVPTAERMLSDKVTSAELKDVLEANTTALRHGGKPTTLGYGVETWASVQERIAKGMRTKPAQLKDHEKDRTAAMDRKIRRWNARYAALRIAHPNATKQWIYEQISEETGIAWRWIAQNISKK